MMLEALIWGNKTNPITLSKKAISDKPQSTLLNHELPLPTHFIFTDHIFKLWSEKAKDGLNTAGNFKLKGIQSLNLCSFFFKIQNFETKLFQNFFLETSCYLSHLQT